MPLNKRRAPQPNKVQTIWSAINYTLYIAVIASVISIIPHSLGFEIMEFNDIVEKKVGVDKGQELYQDRYEYLSKFKGKEKAATEGQMEDLKNMAPLQAIEATNEKSEDFSKTKEMQLYIAQKAQEYKIIGEMKQEHYDILKEKKDSLEDLNGTLKKVKKMRETFNMQMLSQ